MADKTEATKSLAEQELASWQEKLKTEIPDWNNLSSEAKRALADIAVAMEEETGLAKQREPDRWAAPDDVAHAMRRALSRGYKAALAKVTPDQLLIAYQRGSDIGLENQE